MPARPSGGSVGGVGQDRAADALDALIAVLEGNESQTRAALERARNMKRLADLSYPWRQILATEERPLLSDTLFQGMALMNEVVGRLRREEARQLAEEGATREEIASVFGVTLEHVDAMLAAL